MLKSTSPQDYDWNNALVLYYGLKSRFSPQVCSSNVSFRKILNIYTRVKTGWYSHTSLKDGLNFWLEQHFKPNTHVRHSSKCRYSQLTCKQNIKEIQLSIHRDFLWPSMYTGSRQVSHDRGCFWHRYCINYDKTLWQSG